MLLFTFLLQYLLLHLHECIGCNPILLEDTLLIPICDSTYELILVPTSPNQILKGLALFPLHGPNSFVRRPYGASVLSNMTLYTPSVPPSTSLPSWQLHCSEIPCRSCVVVRVDSLLAIPQRGRSRRESSWLSTMAQASSFGRDKPPSVCVSDPFDGS